VLESVVPKHFGMARAETLARAMHSGRIRSERLVELPPAVFRAAGSGDPVARDILDRLADEVVAMATAAIVRVRLAATDVDVVLGGGLFHARDDAFLRRVRAGILRVAPAANVTTLAAPPVVGALLLGLDRIGAPSRARSRLRESVTHASFPGRRSRAPAGSSRRA
jgi:N-acetylglucosamine kinase-like BadF-type ATPase